MREKISSLISWILVIDLGLVLISFGWFVLAVVGRSMNADLGLDLWYSLWNPLILPAISVLMAGAIASGLLGWISKRLNGKVDAS
jgi:TRAP-type C4-dicarboxylate transport system permease small subunit